jgi:hypothetical protein
MKRLAVSAAVLLAPLLVVSGSAGAAPAAITLGELVGASPAFTCGGGGTVIQGAVAPGSPSYTVPARGVITSFSSQANANGNHQVRLALFGAPTGNVFPVRAKSPTFPMLASSVNTFAVRVPVQAGWLLGAQFTGTNVWCGKQTFAAADDLYFSSDSADSPSVSTTSPFDFHVNITAVFEPDVDGDGFGDVSQDACPDSALAVVACPAPETAITKAKAKGPGVTIAFTSTVAHSTFLVTVDSKAPKETLSPYVAKLKPGKHTITVQAVSPLGIADPTPATKKVKVKAPKPQH